MPRKQVNLNTLPAWLRYVIAITVAGLVVVAAWYVGRDEPVPGWVQDYLIPGLGWAFLGLLVIIVLHRVFRK